MAKGYWIGRVDVHDEDGYKPYAAANPGDLQEIWRPLRGARRQVRSARKAAAGLATSCIEFPDYAAALACYRSPEYQAAT